MSEEAVPVCHFKPMKYESADIPFGEEDWWECEVCGHTELAATRSRS